MHGSTGAGSMQETRLASATAAREAGGARTGALALDLTASFLFSSPALFWCFRRSLHSSAFLFLTTFTKPVGRGGSTIEPGAGQNSGQDFCAQLGPDSWEAAEEEDTSSGPSVSDVALSCSREAPAGGGGAGKACLMTGAPLSNSHAGSCAVLARILARTGEEGAGGPAATACVL